MDHIEIAILVLISLAVGYTSVRSRDGAIAYVLAGFGALAAAYYSVGNGFNSEAVFVWLFAGVLAGIGYVASHSQQGKRSP